MPQCAFEMSMFNVSAIHINSRSWLRSSSTHEPSDPPLRISVIHRYREIPMTGYIVQVKKEIWAQHASPIPRTVVNPSR